MSKLLEKICASYSKGAEATDDALNVRFATSALTTLPTPAWYIPRSEAWLSCARSQRRLVTSLPLCHTHLKYNGVHLVPDVRSAATGPDQGTSASQQARRRAISGRLRRRRRLLGQAGPQRGGQAAAVHGRCLAGRPAQQHAARAVAGQRCSCRATGRFAYGPCCRFHSCIASGSHSSTCALAMRH